MSLFVTGQQSEVSFADLFLWKHRSIGRLLVSKTSDDGSSPSASVNHLYFVEVKRLPRIRNCRVHGCKSPAYFPNHYCSKHIEYEKEYESKRQEFAHRNRSKQSQWRYNHVTRNRNPIKAVQNKFYHSKQWINFRNIVLKRDYNLCQYCKARGVVKEGNVVDHVLPVEQFQEKMKDIDNMVTCCQTCHYWKTRFEEKYYGTGLHGKPTHNAPITDIALIAELSDKIKANAHKGS